MYTQRHDAEQGEGVLGRTWQKTRRTRKQGDKEKIGEGGKANSCLVVSPFPCPPVCLSFARVGACPRWTRRAGASRGARIAPGSTARFRRQRPGREAEGRCYCAH